MIGTNFENKIQPNEQDPTLMSTFIPDLFMERIFCQTLGGLLDIGTAKAGFYTIEKKKKNDQYARKVSIIRS